jgi:hypothetical protein
VSEKEGIRTTMSLNFDEMRGFERLMREMFPETES